MLDFLSEMKRVLVFLANLLVCVGVANAAVRDGTAVSRVKSDKNTVATQARSATVVKRETPRTSVLPARSAANSVQNRSGTVARTAVARPASVRTDKNINAKRNMTPIVARAGSDA